MAAAIIHTEGKQQVKVAAKVEIHSSTELMGFGTSVSVVFKSAKTRVS